MGVATLRIVGFFLVLVLLASTTYALDYTVDINSPSSVDDYEGNVISNRFSFVITNNGDFCDIVCGWVTSAGAGNGIKVPYNGGRSSKVYFDVKADGLNGIAPYSLIITCDRITSMTCWSGPDQKTYEGSFSYLWNDDGICSTDREKCAAYKSYLKDSACSCSETTNCNPTSERDTDPNGCTTYCGNGIKESKYETCENCPDDVGKCDGQICDSKTECEGRYCIHNKCGHLPYIIDDTYCDSTEGESCLNSPSDCACPTEQRCNSQGTCETYCGNGICESAEQGTCDSDCQWCGDGVCDPDKETCKGCPSDCGECKRTEQEEEATKQVAKITGAAELSAQKTRKDKRLINMILGGTLGLIVLVVIVYLIYKKKNKGKLAKSQKIESKECPKCHSKNDSTSKFCNECGHKLE